MQQPIRTNQVIVFAQVETVFGETPAFDPDVAIPLLCNVTDADPASTQWAQRSNVQPFMGNKGSVKLSENTAISIDAEIAGSGTVGKAPNVDPLLRAAGFAPSVVDGEGVIYTPLSTGHKSVSLWYFLDGLLHVFSGVRANLSIALNARQIPMMSFTCTGLRGVFSDAPVPQGIDYSGMQIPAAVNEENTTATLHGIASPMESLSIAMGNAVAYENRINHETVRISDRAPTGSTVIDNNLLAVRNWYGVASSGTPGPLRVEHGKQPGNIFVVDAPRTRLTTVKPGDRDGISILNVGLEFMPGTGDDEISFTFE